MTSERELLVETLSRLLGRHCTHEAVAAAENGWDPQLWATLQGLGFTAVSLPEEAGGSGGELADAAAVVRLAGAFAAPVPLAETAMVGGWALAAAGLPIPVGPVTVAPAGHAQRPLVLERDGTGWRCRGRLARVPWGRAASRVVVLALAGAERVVVSLPADAFLVSPAVNLAGEPRDDLVVDGRLTGADVRPAPDSVSATALHARGALARALAMAGALDRLVALTVRHACEREQFGRPIARLQAVQQELAVLAGEAAAAGAAADAAVLADGTEHAVLAIAAAKIRAGRAAGTASAIAHQVHGAIGFTDEHSLHHLTRRLWAWRDEFGSEAEWSRRLGQVFAAAGPERVWSLLTA